ncbi:hypothetical protein [Aquimarina rubra]|uniref:Uncharacterized protein n=1 Tax=Aquimarina rubra TaxID=1920033 RepID=A0ABW5LHR2_9FLAO
MEQALEQKQLITKEQSDSITRWQEEEVLLLARHFQRLNIDNKTSTSHYSRTNFFEMNTDDIKTLNTLKDIKSIRIYMSLEDEDKNKFTFHPIINIKYGSAGNEVWFTLEAKYQKPKVPIAANVNDGGTIVPGIFKEMILANWNSVEDNLIDDLFVAKDERTRALTRVNFFNVSSDMVLELFNTTLQDNISRFIMYPGVDMNKFQHRNMISFTPVIGIVPDTKVLTEVISRHGLVEFDNEEIFIEYSKPCPPTCPPNSN